MAPARVRHALPLQVHQDLPGEQISCTKVVDVLSRSDIFSTAHPLAGRAETQYCGTWGHPFRLNHRDSSNVEAELRIKILTNAVLVTIL